jgi:hypothetical protein
MSAPRRGVCALAVLAGACQFPQPPEAKPVNAFFADPRDRDRVHRVMFLPLVPAPGVNAPADALRAAVLDELAKIQRFELVPLPEHNDEDDAIYHAVLQGEQPLSALVSLGRRYRIDGVVLGTITSYRAYPPAHLGLRLELVSLHSGRAVWAAEGHYDAAEEATSADVQHFARSYLAKEASMHGWEINVISPTRFASFVAHRLVATWRE